MTPTLSQKLRNKLPIHNPGRVKTSSAPRSKAHIPISSSYTSKFNVHKSAIVGEKSFNVASLFTRVMIRGTLNLMSGQFKNILALLHYVLFPSNFSFSNQPYKLVAFSCDCWLTEGLELKAFHHFVFHLIFLNISCIPSDNTQSQHFTVSIMWHRTDGKDQL